MNNDKKIGVIRELENLPSQPKVSDGMFNVEEFRKSLLPTRPMGKLLQFPAPKIVEVSPAQIVDLEKPFDIRETVDFLFAPIPQYIKDGQ